MFSQYDQLNWWQQSSEINQKFDSPFQDKEDLASLCLSSSMIMEIHPFLGFRRCTHLT